MSHRAWVATRKGLFQFILDTSTRHPGWHIASSSFVGEPVSMVLPGGHDHPMIAALNLGHFGVKCHASDDWGDSWHEVAAPAYPAQPEDAQDEIPWKLVQIWSLAAADGVIWAGTLPGGLFRSKDFGDSWQLVESLWDRDERREWMGGGYDTPGIHSICINPQDTQRILLGISCGGAWLTRDGGLTWALRAKGMSAGYMPPDRADDQNIQDPHAIAQCAAAPDTLWCQHHSGIWRSTNAGALWQEIKAPVSSFGFAVAAHPQNADTAWFVPAVSDQMRVPVDAALCVNRTRDGGKSFETLRNGLPQKDCYDLIYRHALAVSDDGQHLMMGSTTGNLWVSDDGGDNWQTLSNTLPPIFAVRFEAIV
ncbi:exo-alpha-sialidase [Uliginosibacterium sp. H3]|uniref:Exo-alpha-sialidase n=1 Tax=Uliginosibacterium silvisoli TaxID=3114758 RepID=A0ABU6K0B3_9RHOO|nr:exo-alpha-sialidase [Uliginosibacterium sp. H3]